MALVLGLAAVGYLIVDSLSAPEEQVAPAGEEVLEVRFGAPPADGPTPVPVHVVTEGETLWSIARDRLGDPDLAGELARLNGLDDPDALVPGQRIRLR